MGFGHAWVVNMCHLFTNSMAAFAWSFLSLSQTTLVAQLPSHWRGHSQRCYQEWRGDTSKLGVVYTLKEYKFMGTKVCCLGFFFFFFPNSPTSTD